MAVDAAEVLAVDLLARVDKLERQLERADNVVDRRLGHMEARGSAFASRFSALIGGVSVAALAREFLKFADVSKQIDSQLRLATRTFGSFAQAQADAQRIAAATRGDLSATANLYGNFVRASQESGRSQEQAARATETFSKALKIGGADAAATASATLQFSQALASGVLRGDEFNSVMEASPRIARLLADALGVPIGQLRKMAEQGKITRDVLFSALTERKFTAGIDDEFRTLPATISDALQSVENAAVITFGAFDRGGEFSNAIANFITGGSDGFKGLARDAEDLGVDVRATLAGLHDVFNPMLDGARSVFDAIGGDTRSLVDQVRADISFILGAIDRFSNLGNPIENAVRGRLGMGPVQATDFQGRFDRGFAERQTAGRQAVLRRRFGAQGAFDLNKPGGTAVLSLQPNRVDRSTDGDGKKKKGPSAETLARRAETERLRGLRNDEAFETEKDGLQRDLLRARQATATAADTVASFELQEIEAARSRQNTSYQRDVSEKKLTQARANELVALNDQLAAARAATVQVEQEERARAGRALLMQADLANARDLASAEADLALTSRDRRAAALRVLDLEYKLERARLEAIQASRDSTDAEKEVARRRLAVLPGMQDSARARVEQDTAGPIDRYRQRLQSSVGDANEALEGVAVNGLASLEDGLEGIIGGTESVGDAFKKMANGIIADLARVAIQQAILSAFKGPSSDGGAAGKAGGILGFLGKVFGGARASGGPVASGKTYLVGERGPELLTMGGQSGYITPNQDMSGTLANMTGMNAAVARPAAMAQPSVARVELMLSGDIDARIVNASAGVHVQLLRAEMPNIMQAATVNTVNELTKQRL